jgi:hypothetical protein
MNNIAIVFIQTDRSLSIENCISSYIEHNPIENYDVYCIHQLPIQNKIDKIIYSSIQPEYYKYIEQLIPISSYSYLLLLPNQYIVNTPISLNEYLPYLKNNIYQLQFLQTVNPSTSLQYIVNTPEFRYDSYKQIFNNPRPDTSTDLIDYHIYSEKNYNSIFKLVPSILNIKNLELQHNIPIFSNTIYQRYYNNIFFRNNYTSISVDTPLVKNTSYSDNTIIDHEVTVVTAFIKVNNASKKHKYDYVECAKKTLSLPNPMVIYISEDLHEEVKKIRTELGLIERTKLIILTVENFYMYSEKNLLDQCCMKNNSPYNNSLYIMSVNSRYSYLEKAIQNNYFNTDYYAWVDFGISHIVVMDNIRSITYNNPLHVRIAWIARKNLVYNHKSLGGGIFAAHKDTMKILCKLHDIEFKYNLSLGHCINDDKTLFFIYLNYPELFDIYFSGYNCLYEKFFTG